MPTFKLSSEYIHRIRERFNRYQKIRAIIFRNVDEYISDFMNFQGTPQERDEYLADKYSKKAPSESYLALFSGGSVLFHVKDIALLTGRDSSSTSRMLANIERSEGWYSRLVSLRHEVKSANNNTIYAYDRDIFGLIMDYRESQYLERIRRGGKADFGEVVKFWEYLKKIADTENESFMKIGVVQKEITDSESSSVLPDVPPVSWSDVIRIISGKLFSVKADMIFAVVFAVTFMVARKWTFLIPVFAVLSAVGLVTCAVILRKRSSRTELLAELGAVATLSMLFWGINLTMDNGIYTPGGTVMNLTQPEAAINVSAARGEYLGHRDCPVIFFVDADNEAEIAELFYRTDGNDDYSSTGRNEVGGVQFLLTPKITGDTIMIDMKYSDTDGKEHGPYKFTFNVEEERYKSGKNAVINHPEILWLSEYGGMTVINSFMNDTIKAIHYGVNTESPDRVYVPDFDEGYHGDGSYIVDETYSEVDFVSLYTEFTDGTSSDIHIKDNVIHYIEHTTPSEAIIL